MKQLAKCASLDVAWKLIDFLNDKVKTWKPKPKFVVVLSRPDSIEIWPWLDSPLRDLEHDALRKYMQAFIDATWPVTKASKNNFIFLHLGVY